MHRDTDERLDPAEPALVVTYGLTPHKVRPLTGNLVVLGKGRACDVGLMSPEVADTHCVLFQTGRGWRLRDCGSRLGTRVNGKIVHETALCDGDVLQVGNFNFRLHLPDAAQAGSPAEARLQRSRRRLAGLALRLRRRLREERAAHASQADLDRAMAVLRERLRECEQKAERLQQEERELAQDRAALDGEYAAFQARIDEAEQALARRQSEVEADLRRRWQEAKPPAEAEELRELRAQLAAARRENEEKEAQIQQLLAQQRVLDPSSAGTDRETYEAELAEFRRQLHEDRTGMSVEIRELRARTVALEEAARVMEQQLAQERAELSAERAELDRLRADGGGEFKPPAAPGRLTGTHRLKGTMVNRVVSGAGPAKPSSAGRIPRVRLPRRGDA